MTEQLRVTELELERRELKAEIAKNEAEIKRLLSVEEDFSEVREQWQIAPDADFVRSARQFREQYEAMVAESTALLMDSASAIVAEKVKVESVRPLVMELVRSEKPATRKALTRVIDEVLSRESIQTVLAAKVVAEMGAAQPAPVSTTPGAAPKSFLKPKPEVA